MSALGIDWFEDEAFRVFDGPAEFATDEALSCRVEDLRPVYCPSCGKHYSVEVDEEHRLSTVVHYVCGSCGGDGRPASLEVSR